MAQKKILILCIGMLFFQDVPAAATQPPLVPEGETFEQIETVIAQLGQYSPINALALSQDNTLLALASADSQIYIWDLQQKRAIQQLSGHKKAVLSVAFSAQNHLLASSGADNMIYLWDRRQGQPLKSFQGHQSAVNSIAFSPNGQLLASASGAPRRTQDNTVRLWSVANAQEILQLTTHHDAVNSVVFSPNGQVLASGSSDQLIQLWDVETGLQLNTLKGHVGAVKSLAFSPDGHWLTSGAADNTVRLWDWQKGQEIKQFKGHASDVLSVAFSPEGHLIASSSGEAFSIGDNSIRLWDIEQGQEILRLNAHNRLVSTIAFSADSRFLVSGSWDTTTCLWDLNLGQLMHRFEAPVDAVNNIVFSADGQTLISGGGELFSLGYHRVRLWDIDTGQAIWQLPPQAGAAVSVAAAPQGQFLALGVSDVLKAEHNQVIIWDLKVGQAIYQWPIDTGVVLDVALSPDGQRVAASTGEIFGAGDNLIYLWDMHQGQLVQQLAGHHAAITHIEFNPLKPLLASASWDQSVRLWDLEQGEEIHKFTAHDDQVLSVAWHPQGEQLASGSADGMIYLWDQEGIKQTLEGHLAAVTSVAFSPYGHLLASGATDSSVRLWDLKQGLEVEKFQGHWAAISSVAFSPGGHLLASSSEEGSIRLWQLFSGRWQRVFINGSGDTWMSCVHSSCLRFDDGRLMTTHNAQNEIQAVLPPYRAGGELTLLEVPQKPLVVTEGQLQQFSLTVRNTGKQPLYWLTVQQQPPYQRLLLHAPETLGTLWPGETHTLSLAISGGADYQQPQQRLLTLKLDIHTAYTAPLSVEIPVDLQVSELSLDNIKLTGQQRQALAMHLTHHGQQGLPQIKLSAHLDNILLDTVNYPENPQEKTILAGQQQLNIVFPIPEHMNVTQHSRAQLRIRKPNYPPHVWLFPQQPIQLATLTWQTILFYTGTLAFILLLWHYGHLYYHPWIRRLTQKATPLTQFPVQQLPKLHAKLKGSGHLDAILTQNHLPAAVFDEAVLFMHMSAVVKAHILAQRLGGFCEDKGRLPSSYAHSGHYIQFTLPGVITCWFYFPEPKLAITQIFAHLHQYMRAHKVIIITFNHQHKQILRLYGYRLDWWKVPSEYELTAWLIGSEPQHIFYQILGDE